MTKKTANLLQKLERNFPTFTPEEKQRFYKKIDQIIEQEKDSEIKEIFQALKDWLVAVGEVKR